jgi:hypothetical protein
MNRKFIIMPILLVILCCSNYASKTKMELFHFFTKGIKYDSIYSFPYQQKDVALLVQTSKNSGTSFYSATAPLPDSVYKLLKSKNGPERDSILQKQKVHINYFMSSIGKLNLSKLGFSFLDTSIVNLDSIKFDSKWKPASGSMFLRINKIGETDLKVVSYDTTFFVHFKIDSAMVFISNPGYSKRWEEKAFLWFTWPIKEEK